MNDSQIVRKLKQLEVYRQKIEEIISDISTSDHPKAEEIASTLYDECWFPAWPEHVAFRFLDQRRWTRDELPDGSPGGIISKRAKGGA